MKVIVVGAGFAGLAAADELHRAGVEVTVFEARDRVGGCGRFPSRAVWSSAAPSSSCPAMRWHADPWARGAYSAQSASSGLDTEELVRPVGPLAFAGEHTAGPWHGLMEGALRSGARAAQQLLQITRR